MARKRRSSKKAAQEFKNRPLSGLKDLTPPTTERPDSSREQRQRSARSAGSRSGDDGNDQATFSEAMAGVTPMEGRNTSLPPEPCIRTKPSASEEEEAEVMQALHDLVDGEAPFSILQTDEAIEGRAEGVDSRLLRKLKRGEFSVQDHLDLHGYSREEARPVVARFLLEAITLGKRCVLIIHGRGHGSKDKIPVLKLALKTWLVRSGIRKSILAFCTARSYDGGAGAVYVLLRKARRSP